MSFTSVALPLKADSVERYLDLKQQHYMVWKTIGEELGVDAETLTAIETDCTDNEDRLHAVINSANPAPTLKSMIEILKSANVAKAISGIYIVILLIEWFLIITENGTTMCDQGFENLAYRKNMQVTQCRF